jgi:hypothetical protein
MVVITLYLVTQLNQIALQTESSHHDKYPCSLVCCYIARLTERFHGDWWEFNILIGHIRNYACPSAAFLFVLRLNAAGNPTHILDAFTSPYL